jgi:CDP-diacylglycerol--glycerol-3-phosphate 3-phosphatidyltransferase
MKKYIPIILLYSRLFFVFIIICLTIFQSTHSVVIVLSLMYIGVVADIFDGIIARKLNVSTENFRILDTIFDLLFYCSIVLFIYTINSKPFYENALLISTIFILEFLMYFICLIRFKKFPSPHAIISKFWGLYLLIEFTLLIIGVTGKHFTIALIFGIIVHVDRLLIYMLIINWDHDIPSCYHAFQLKQGKTITRNKLFNG